MNNVIHNQIIELMEAWAPKSLAYDWDPVGLQIGSKTIPTKNILVTLDVNERVIDEAIKSEANLIIAHHPMMFKPIKQIDYDSPRGQLIKKIINHDLTVYAAHTNLDIAKNGVNDMLAKELSINNINVLQKTGEEQLFKLVVFVPNSHSEQVFHALAEAGAGHIGNYSHCTFQTNGRGTFKPLAGTNPFSGKQDKISFDPELKIETIVKKSDLRKIINVMIAAHPYEEVAYDLFPLANQGEVYGLGRVGILNDSVTLEQFAHNVKQKLQLDFVRITGDLEKKINKVAIVGGSGEKYISHAKAAGADVLITGDMTFHVAQDAEAMDLAVIDAGHYIEKVMISYTRDYLMNKFPDLKIIGSNINTNPFKYF